MKLYLMQLALLQPLGVPVPGYVIQMDDGRNILVDCQGRIDRLISA